ncbi:hypothetical protein AB2L28_08185 [Kineococcus sp. TBRC 1896]|uniref:Uncharacterized protein n=1 Tax=Kineococcus mangrovi TaxID=1660183 RepID=A0ABV4I0K9_9ACTN
MRALPLRLAAGALLVGGFLLGIAPLPLANFGCRSAFGGRDDLDPSIEIATACSEAVSGRQDVIAVLLVSGVAVLGLSFGRSRTSGG